MLLVEAAALTAEVAAGVQKSHRFPNLQIVLAARKDSAQRWRSQKVPAQKFEPFFGIGSTKKPHKFDNNWFFIALITDPPSHRQGGSQIPCGSTKNGPDRSDIAIDAKLQTGKNRVAQR
jgi:hypothetical protein